MLKNNSYIIRKEGIRMSYEQQKLEYEGKVLLAEETKEFLKDAMEDIKESAKVQHEKDKENFVKIKEETKVRHEAAIAQGKAHRVDIEAQIAKAKELGRIRK